MKTLILGCGQKKTQRLVKKYDPEKGAGLVFEPIEGEIVTVDINPNHDPDLLLDLNERPLPFADNEFDCILAYEVLEHIGVQGDYKRFFEEFSEYWRILKPDGTLEGTVPHWGGPWAWGDPSHTRVIPLESFTFLDQTEYEKQVGKTAMIDFRYIYKADFEPLSCGYLPEQGYFVLRARKPAYKRGDPLPDAQEGEIKHPSGEGFSQ